MTEACYWCAHIKADSGSSMDLKAFCEKKQASINLEDEGCEMFQPYESLRRLLEATK